MIFSARVFKNPKVPRQVLPRRAKDRNFTSDTVDKIHYLPCQHYLPCLLAIGQGWISRICAVNFVVIAVVVLELKFHEKITRMTHFVVPIKENLEQRLADTEDRPRPYFCCTNYHKYKL